MGEGAVRVDPVPCSRWPASGREVKWFDLTSIDLTAEELLPRLEPQCPGITAAMLRGLLTPDDRPIELRFGDGSIRLASSFGVSTERPLVRVPRGEPRPAGRLVIEQVELLAGDGWLASCWHPTRVFRGNDLVEAAGPPAGEIAIRERIMGIWKSRTGGTSGDLGMHILNELALTYAPALRAISSWHEDWELGFYTGDQRFDRGDLATLWGARALLRDWLTPLNIPGVAFDPDRGWMPGADRELVRMLDDRIHRSLAGLDRLGDSLRSSFSLLHVQQTEAAQLRTEAVQRRIGMIAAAFLVPSLIVGFYGANTWVPGEHSVWGFAVMVAVLIFFTGVTVSLLTLLRHRQAAEDRRERDRREQIRAAIFRGR